jgi:hypothetical protein
VSVISRLASEIERPTYPREIPRYCARLLFSDKVIFILSQKAGSERFAHPLDCCIRVEVTVCEEYARCLPVMVVRLQPIFAKILSLIIVQLTRYVITGSLISAWHFTPRCSLQLNSGLVTTKRMKEGTFKIL